MVAVHLGLFWLLAALVAVWLGCLLLPGLGRGARLASGAVLAVAGAAALVGLALALSGRRPHDGLHLLYGALALAVVPLLRAYDARMPQSRRRNHLIGALLLAGFMLRLYATA